MAYRSCTQSVPEVVHQIKMELQKRKILLFAEIDHLKNSEFIDKTHLPATILIFGKPEMGADLLKEAPAIAWDLPLKFLVLAQPEGGCRIVWADMDALELRYGIFEHRQALYKMNDLLNELATSICGKAPITSQKEHI